MGYYILKINLKKKKKKKGTYSKIIINISGLMQPLTALQLLMSLKGHSSMWSPPTFSLNDTRRISYVQLYALTRDVNRWIKIKTTSRKPIASRNHSQSQPPFTAFLLLVPPVIPSIHVSTSKWIIMKTTLISSRRSKLFAICI